METFLWYWLACSFIVVINWFFVTNWTEVDKLLKRQTSYNERVWCMVRFLPLSFIIGPIIFILWVGMTLEKFTKSKE